MRVLIFVGRGLTQNLESCDTYGHGGKKKKEKSNERSEPVEKLKSHSVCLRAEGVLV